MKSKSPQQPSVHRPFSASRRDPASPVIVWSVVAVVWTLITGTPVTAERFSIGEAVSNDPGKTRLILLRDNEGAVEAAIAPEKGGELSGLRIQHRGKWIETIYLARDYSPREAWTGKAPLLWPATGRSFPPDLEARRKAGEVFHDGAWIYKGKRYEMPIHGFARDLSWRVDHSDAVDRQAIAKLSVRDTSETRKSYPFGFLLEVTYTLKEGYLTIAYRVLASEKNGDAMPFSIGNHITLGTRAPSR